MPSSSTTVSALYNAVGLLFPAFTGPNDPRFLRLVNLANEQIVNNGTWDGNVVWTVFNGSQGYIVLPYNMQSVIGFDVNGCPQMVFGQFHEYAEVGPGQFKATMPGCGPMIDVADGWPTQKLISSFAVAPATTASGTITIAINNPADAGIILRFEGKNAAGQVITDAGGARGITMVTVFPTVTSSQVFTEISSIQVQTPTTIPPFKNPWQLYVNISGPQQIGSYLPFETNPQYHAYKTGTWNTNVPLACLCRLRPTPVFSENDRVVPDNLNAFKFALQAVDKEDTANTEGSYGSKLLWQDCYALLNSEHRSKRGKAQYHVNLNPHGAGQRPVANSH